MGRNKTERGLEGAYWEGACLSPVTGTHLMIKGIFVDIFAALAQAYHFVISQPQKNTKH